MQGKGIGKALGVLLADEARGRGVNSFSASILADNRPALRLMATMSQRLDGAHRPRRARRRGRFGRLSADDFDEPRRPSRRARCSSSPPSAATASAAGCLIGFAHAVQHQAAALPRLHLEGEPDLRRRVGGGRRSPSTSSAASSCRWPSCSAARPATRSTSSSSAHGRAGPGGVPVLDDVPGWFAGRVLDRLDLGDHLGLLPRPGRCQRTAAAARPGFPGCEGDRSLATRCPKVENQVMGKTLVVAEKPSVGRDIAAALPGTFKAS